MTIISEPNRIFFQTEPKQTHSELNPSFFKNQTESETEIKKSIPHIPTGQISGVDMWT